MKKQKLPFVSVLFKKLAKRAGVSVHLEPKYGYVGQIVTRSGKKRYFRTTKFDINTLGATEISADKDYASYFMRRMGYPVARGEAFFSTKWCKAISSKRNLAAAYRYAQRLGFPVIVKPNSKSQGVAVAKAHTKKEFERAFNAAAKVDTVILVQEVLTGHDYRLVVLDGAVISAYERLPLSVVGDGRSTIRTLLRAKQQQFRKQGRDTVIKADDWRIRQKLARGGYALSSVPERGVRIALLDNANLSSGGDSLDVTETIHPGFRDIAVRLTRDMGLRLCGVDLMVAGDIREGPQKYWVLEINSAPGLDHYFSKGKKQEKIVEGLYLQLLKSMNT